MTVLVQAVITKYHRQGDFHNKNLFYSEFWKLGSSRSRFWPIQFLVRSLFLLADNHLLVASSDGLSLYLC